MREAVAKNDKTPRAAVHQRVTHAVNGFSPKAKEEFFSVIDKVPMAYPEGERDLRDAGEEEPGVGRHLLDLRLGSLQGMRGVRHCLRRAPGAADGAGNRGGQRRARKRHRVPQPAARHVAEVSRPLQRHAAAGFEDRDAPQHADGAEELRRAGLRRRRLRGLRREEHPARGGGGHRGVHAAALSREGRSLPPRRPTSSRRPANRSSRS